MNNLSPKYINNLRVDIQTALFETYKTYKYVEQYLKDWRDWIEFFLRAIIK